MMLTRRAIAKAGRFLATLAFSLTIFAASPNRFVTPAAASEIKVVVNGQPITSYDFQRRNAFFKLARKPGGAAAVKAELIDEALQAAEMKRLGIRISDKAVAEAYARFASQNKLSTKQLDQIMNQSGVTPQHFKGYIRAQMGWNQALSAKFRSEGLMKEQDAVKKMLGDGGKKPTATEYMLQQVVFVVPAKERKGKIGARKREAEAFRQRYQGCASSREFAKGLVDVTVRDLGRLLAPELPPEWEKDVKATQPGKATPVRETEKGVEFLGICSTREVSDDKVAQLVFSNDGKTDDRATELSKKYTEELRAKANIEER
ncbi:MAG: peptidylprolyl isomerase [Phyllobacteriaceae bacterium]|nr:peptidylprolyl isomerase [Phyllobacteriaceae bacterium]